jgi:hypothetical protein
MTRQTTLAHAGLLAAGLAAPAAALADRPTEEVAFYYNKIAFRYATQADAQPAAATPMLTPIDPLPGPAGGDIVMKGANIGINAVPSSKPKEIVVVGSKPPTSGLEAGPSLRAVEPGNASRRAHPDFLWAPTTITTSPAPTVKAPSKPQAYPLIELVPLKGRR